MSESALPSPCSALSFSALSPVVSGRFVPFCFVVSADSPFRVVGRVSPQVVNRGFEQA